METTEGGNVSVCFRFSPRAHKAIRELIGPKGSLGRFLSELVLQEAARVEERERLKARLEAQSQRTQE